MPQACVIDLPAAFPDFVLRCARAFEPLLPCERIEPSLHHHILMEEAIMQLDRVLMWSDEEIQRQADLVYWKEMEVYDLSVADAETLAAKYRTMLLAVETWTPPTAAHEPLKTFMREQLTQSLAADCDVTVIASNKPKPVEGPMFRHLEITRLRHDIEYHRRKYVAEVEQARVRTAWITTLRASLRP